LFQHVDATTVTPPVDKEEKMAAADAVKLSKLSLMLLDEVTDQLIFSTGILYIIL